MKQIIIFLLLIIAFFIGYGKYSQYKRYHSPKVNYTTDKKIDIDYYNKEIVMKYYAEIEALNSYIMLQWSANNIDVRTPKDDNNKTQTAIKKYANKLANIKYYEAILEESLILKNKGLSNEDIKYLKETGISLNEHKNNILVNTIKSMYNSSKTSFKQNKALIYEIQKQLIKKGYKIKSDGVYKKATINALKIFEEKNDLFADGHLDTLTLNVLFE